MDKKQNSARLGPVSRPEKDKKATQTPSTKVQGKQGPVTSTPFDSKFKRPAFPDQSSIAAAPNDRSELQAAAGSGGAEGKLEKNAMILYCQYLQAEALKLKLEEDLKDQMKTQQAQMNAAVKNLLKVESEAQELELKTFELKLKKKLGSCNIDIEALKNMNNALEETVNKFETIRNLYEKNSSHIPLEKIHLDPERKGELDEGFKETHEILESLNKQIKDSFGEILILKNTVHELRNNTTSLKEEIQRSLTLYKKYTRLTTSVLSKSFGMQQIMNGELDF